AYNSNLPRVTRFASALGQNLALYRQYQTLAASAEAARFDAAQRKVLDNTLRDFRLGGAELAPEAQQRFAAIKEELSALSAKFAQNVLDATDAWSLIIEDEARLKGLPEDVKAAAHAAAQKDGKAGWKLT
ncbi:oligopeptidase A, partial [Escherichia coli]|nr:oligopeptidase A [Escherichia coli]